MLRRTTLLATLLAAVAVLLHASAMAADEAGARALFYNAAGQTAPVATASAPVPARARARPRLAIRASVLLTGPDGRTQEVAPSRGFSSGEQIRLAVTPNQSGYLYLLAVAPGGDVQLLSPRDGQSASVRGRQTVVFPQGGRSLRFTGATGREQIWVVLSRTPLQQVPLGSAGMFDLSSGQFAAVATPAAAPPAASAVDGVTASRDLALEEDAGAVYAALPAPGAAHSVALQLALEHQRSDRH